MEKVRLFYDYMIMQNGEKTSKSSCYEADLKRLSSGYELEYLDSEEGEVFHNLISFSKDKVRIKRNESILDFELNKYLKCEYDVGFSKLELKTHLFKYVLLENDVYITYELLLENESIGVYIHHFTWEGYKND